MCVCVCVCVCVPQSHTDWVHFVLLYPFTAKDYIFTFFVRGLLVDLPYLVISQVPASALDDGPLCVCMCVYVCMCVWFLLTISSADLWKGTTS